MHYIYTLQKGKLDAQPFGNFLQHFQKRRRMQQTKQSTTNKTSARRKRERNNPFQPSINCDTG